LKDLDIDGLDFFYWAEVRNHWQAVASTVMNFWFPQMAGNFMTDGMTYGYQREGNCVVCQ